MSKIIRVKDLKYILSSLGYEPEETRGLHNVYQHPVTNSLIIFQGRKANEQLPEIILSAIIKNIINSNVAKEQEIQKLIEQVSNPLIQPVSIKTKASPMLHSSGTKIKREANI